MSTVIDLTRLVMLKMGWNKADLSRLCKLNRQMVQEYLKRERKLTNRDDFCAFVIRAGVNLGLLDEVVDVLAHKGFVLQKSSLLFASMMFPNLTARELSVIRKTEKSLKLPYLDSKLIRQIVEAERQTPE